MNGFNLSGLLAPNIEAWNKARQQIPTYPEKIQGLLSTPEGRAQLASMLPGGMTANAPQLMRQSLVQMQQAQTPYEKANAAIGLLGTGLGIATDAPSLGMVRPIGLSSMNIDALSKYIKEKHDLKHFNAFDTDHGIRLNMIEVPKEARKMGVGTKAMQDLIDYADANGKRIILTPGLQDAIHGTTSRSRLVKFYKKLGFIENKGRNKDFTISEGMYRDPIMGR